MSRFVLRSVSPLLAMMFFGSALDASGQDDLEAGFLAIQRSAAYGSYSGQEEFEVGIELSGDNPEIRHDPASGRVRVLYRMNFNQVAEGWSWQPQADPARQDYYRFKYLPLGTREVERGAPRKGEDLPGRVREFRNVWRYAYYFAFENPYEFFDRPQLEDDAGFSVDLTGDAVASVLADRGSLRMVAKATRLSPYAAESTTYWRATDGTPTELTLKNRYVIGRLTEVRFLGNDGRTLGRLIARPQHH